MKIECHIIQNFPPHCLNRDDTNSPKDCEFGGVRRARISSQCFKRAVRDAFEKHQSFSTEMKAVRTKRIVDQVTDVLMKNGKPEADAKRAVVALLSQVDLKTETKDGAERTQYLLFLPARKLQQLAGVAAENWDALLTLAAAQEAENTDQGAGEDEDGKPASDDKAKGKAKGKTKGRTKKADTPSLPKEVRAKVEELLRDARETPEIALFGRMIANNPEWNVEAACQVAQALSTHRVSMEFDFFTAVDDLKKDSDSGSDMMGTVQFNSACFYRYAVVDHEGLLANLGGAEQEDLALTTVRAFLEAFVRARPTGKQNSMAAHTLPSLVLLTVRDAGEPLSLANAFVKPVTVRKPDDDLEQQSCAALLRHYECVTRMYPGGIRAAYVCALEPPAELPPGVEGVASVDELIDKACNLLRAEARAA